MHVVLSGFHDSQACAWCEREKECVTADFGEGFIRAAPLCWKCLQKALKVHARQADAAPTRKPESKTA